MGTKILYISTVSVGTLAGCIKPFTPVTTTTNANILVIEGFISTNDSTIVKLSRTVIVASKTSFNAETKATITIEDAQSTVYTLTETVKGTYVTPALSLDNTKQYRLRIKTSNGKTYISALVNVQVTPPIDSIGFNLTPAGMQVYADAHDLNTNARYYKYTYRETWKFHAFFDVEYIADGTGIVPRTAAQLMYYCYQTDTSANITLASTATLSQNLVYQAPIALVPPPSEKIEIEYSILVAQRALSKDAYTFWFNLRKNTEELGSIFDALPFQAAGNIYNISDTLEPVIGFVSAGTVQKKRVFIFRRSIPSSWITDIPGLCSADSAFYNFPPNPKIDPKGVGGDYISLFGEHGGGWLYSLEPTCIDCRVRGNIKPPSYWK